MKISWLWLGLAVAALVFLAACGGAETEAPEPESEAVAAAEVPPPPPPAVVEQPPLPSPDLVEPEEFDIEPYYEGAMVLDQVIVPPDVAQRGVDPSLLPPPRALRSGSPPGSGESVADADDSVIFDKARQYEEELARVAQVFPFLKERLGQRAGTLSGGEQKMLLIARALMARPKLMLVDEITEGLQPSIIEQLTEALAVQRERTGVAMLLVEQNVRFALNVADRWVVLKLGEIDDAGKSDAHNAAARIADHLSV